MKRLFFFLSISTLFLSFSADFTFSAEKWIKAKNNPDCSFWIDPNPFETTLTGTWSGNCLNGKLHGKGLFIVKYRKNGKWTGYVHHGHFKKGLEDGQGTRIWTTGIRYEGKWKKGKFNGQGTLIFASGKKYVGEFKDGKYHGQGTLTFASGKKYVGIWVSGRFQDPSKEVKKQKRFVEKKTDFSSSLPKCKNSPGRGINGGKYWNKCVGTVMYMQRSRRSRKFYLVEYRGEWKNGEKHGKGIKTIYKDKAKTKILKVDKGKWVANKFVGSNKGFNEVQKFLSSTLPKCHGSPANYGTRRWNDCIGILNFRSGSRYVGMWKKGKRHGKGILFYSSGNRYMGDWKKGKRHGKATLMYQNGARLVVQYTNGKRHGRGTYTNKNGKVKKEIWIHGKLDDGKLEKKYASSTGLPVCKGSPLPYALSNTDDFLTLKKWDNCVGIAHKPVLRSTEGGIWKKGKISNGTLFFVSSKRNKTITYVGEFKDGIFHGKGIWTKHDMRTNKKIKEFKGFFAKGKFIGSKEEMERVKKKAEEEKKLMSSTGLPKCKGSPLPSDRTASWNNCVGVQMIAAVYGNQLMGVFKNGEVNGQGIYYYKKGGKYVGGFKNGNFHGQGTMYYHKGGKYVGGWKNNSKHGQGTDYYSDGSKYVGRFKNNKLHGHVTYYKKSGKKEKRIYVNGETVEQLFAGIYFNHHYLDLCLKSNLINKRKVTSVQKLTNKMMNAVFKNHKIARRKQNVIKDAAWEASLKKFNGTTVIQWSKAAGLGRRTDFDWQKKSKLQKICRGQYRILDMAVSHNLRVFTGQTGRSSTRRKRRF